MASEEKKKLQRQRSMSYFINAAIDIINEEGLSGLSIRKTSDKAGYNSATLYHYFTDFEELCTFAAIRYVDEYAKDLPSYLAQASRPLMKYLKVWECFCLHSFTHPDIFWHIFFKNFQKENTFSHYFQTYYEIFPEEWNEEVMEYKQMLISDSLYDREYIALTKSLQKEHIQISANVLPAVNEMNILLYRGMLETLREQPELFTPENAAEKVVRYIRKTLTAYNIL